LACVLLRLADKLTFVERAAQHLRHPGGAIAGTLVPDDVATSW
jgi:hypothetical protein